MIAKNNSKLFATFINQIIIFWYAREAFLGQTTK